MSDEEPCILKVGEAMLAGEIEYRKANFDQAFQHLREAVRCVDVCRRHAGTLVANFHFTKTCGRCCNMVAQVRWFIDYDR